MVFPFLNTKGPGSGESPFLHRAPTRLPPRRLRIGDETKAVDKASNPADQSQGSAIKMPIALVAIEWLDPHRIAGNKQAVLLRVP